ncbi:hypothetical protein N656DRAFT_630714 [Canariomyces notabilis]|uniref:Uncharacterized protein n=1 Tax=Canariomyces notabilis TaxID=2074819 RepID=A0AAN6TGR6_9PEZI|nr:hypothetical protein N656DRAFT_630714 [Canariomyces arenarius]
MKTNQRLEHGRSLSSSPVVPCSSGTNMEFCWTRSPITEWGYWGMQRRPHPLQTLASCPARVPGRGSHRYEAWCLEYRSTGRHRSRKCHRSISEDTVYQYSFDFGQKSFTFYITVVGDGLRFHRIKQPCIRNYNANPRTASIMEISPRSLYFQPHHARL